MRILPSDCRCARSQEACWRRATNGALCDVCANGCGELRFGAPSDIFVMMKVVAAHEPMIMELQTRIRLARERAGRGGRG